MSDAPPTLLLRGVASFSGERRDMALAGERIGDARARGLVVQSAIPEPDEA